MSFAQKITAAGLGFAFTVSLGLLGLTFLKPEFFKEISIETLRTTLTLISTLSTGASRVVDRRNDDDKAQ